jgi:hypothetical protein
MVMLRKTLIAVLAIAAAGTLMPGIASARGGFGGGGGGGFHGASMGGGGGGGFHAAAMGRGGFSAGAMGGGSGFRSAAVGPGNGFRSATIGNRAWNANALAGGPVRSGPVGASGFHPGFHRGFHHRFPVGTFAAGIGYGIYDPYAYYGDDYAYNDYYDDGGCYVVQRRVHTRYGWRLRPVQVCG